MVDLKKKIRALSHVVAEKYLTEKVYRQTNKQTNIITEKAKTIYPLYTSYRGYKNLHYLIGPNKYTVCIFIGENSKFSKS